MNIALSLLENGFDFLACAINNVNIAREESTDEEAKVRLTKYAVLHLSSGIELILKHRLLEENWTYIFADMNKANRRSFEKGDFRSVDSISNIERLRDLVGISFSKDEENIFKSLRNKRNMIEHFKINESIQAVESIMCSSLAVILYFIAKHTKIDSLSFEESDLLDHIKKDTASLEEVVTAREKLIESSAKIDGVLDDLLVCPQCAKRFLLCRDQDIDIQCLYCYYTDTPEHVADAYLYDVLGISSHYCAMNCEEYPLYECPECGSEAFIFDANRQAFFCFACNFSANESGIHFCSDCNRPIKAQPSDYECCLCHDCIDNRIHRDD